MNKIKNCGYGMIPVAIMSLVIFGAMIAAAAEIGAEVDGSLRWIDYVGVAIQFGPLLVLAALIAVGRQIADDIRLEMRRSADAHLEAVEALRAQQASFLAVIDKLAK